VTPAGTYFDREWFPFDRPAPDAPYLLIALPVAGAGASSLRDWRNEMPSDIALCTPQLPGRESRLSEPPILTMTALVEALLHALRRRIDRPFALLGHSMGGIVALELANRLQSIGMPAQWLFVSACRPPDLWREGNPVRGLSDQQISEYLGHLGGSPPELLANRELMSLLLPTIKADYEVLSTYNGSTAQRVRCPITVFGGSNDPLSPVDAYPRWDDWTTSSFSLEVYAGDHFFHTVHRTAMIASIAKSLRGAIDTLGPSTRH
jgi:medium-chain acyl-[acyl-carrier-protein] hydrolase